MQKSEMIQFLKYCKREHDIESHGDCPFLETRNKKDCDCGASEFNMKVDIMIDRLEHPDLDLEALWESEKPYSDIYGILYIRGDCVPVGAYNAHWDGMRWTLEFPEETGTAEK